MMARFNNTPQTASAAYLLAGTVWAIESDTREITRVENARVSEYDRRTVLAEVYWRKPGGKERSQPTPLTTFRRWLNKARQVQTGTETAGVAS